MGALHTGTQANNFELVVQQNHGRPQGVKTVICPSLEIETKNQNLWENLTSAAQFQLVDLFLAMTVYLPVWHSHCIRARFTVLGSCSGELSVHSSLLLCLQGQVAKLADCFTVGFYCVTITWQQIFWCSLQVTMVDVVCHMWLLNADILASNAARQWLLIRVNRNAESGCIEGQQGQRCLFQWQHHRLFYGLSRSNWNKFSIVFLIIFQVSIVVEQYSKHNW